MSYLQTTVKKSLEHTIKSILDSGAPWAIVPILWMTWLCTNNIWQAVFLVVISAVGLVAVISSIQCLMATSSFQSIKKQSGKLHPAGGWLEEEE